MKESADIFTILSWLKRNGDLFDKKDLIMQLMSRFHIDKDKAISLIKNPSMVEAKMISFNKYKLDPKEEDALMWFIANKKKNWDTAKAAKDAGKFTKLGIIMELAKWYEEKGFLTQKQLGILEKWKATVAKESFGGSYARPSNYPIQSGLPPTTVKEAFGLNEEDDAVFIGWQSGFKARPPMALYNVTKKDHEKYKSTVTTDTLDKLGLKYQPPPPYKGDE